MSFTFDYVPIEQRCYQSTEGQFCTWPAADCFFGVPEDALYGRRPLKTIPSETTGFHFYLGADQQALIESFTESDFPAFTTALHIGNSSYGFGKGRDYSGLTASLTQVDFPKLEILELGVWQLFSNSHCAYGQVGVVDALAPRMPRLKQLYIYGKCELCSPLSFPDLELLHVIVNDPITGINGGALDSMTVSNILSSSFPKLQELYVDLEIDDGDVYYSVPDAIMTDDLFPNLTAFELAGTFHVGEKSRLINSPTLRNKNIKLHLSEMVEAPREE